MAQTFPLPADKAKQQLVQYLVDDFQSRALQESRALYESIAQSLVAIKNQIALISRRFPADDPEVAAQIQSLDANLQTVLEQIRRLADSTFINTLDNLGLSSAIEELCLVYQDSLRSPIIFSGLPCPQPSSRGQRQRSLCLYYFTDQALRYACQRASGPVAVSIDCEPGQIGVHISFEQVTPQETAEDERLLLILQEWLAVWGGHIQYFRSLNHHIALSALIDIEQG